VITESDRSDDEQHDDFDVTSGKSSDGNLLDPMSRLSAADAELLLRRRRLHRRRAQRTYDRMLRDGRLSQEVDADTGRLNDCKYNCV